MQSSQENVARPEMSVVIPLYNSASLLEELHQRLQSVLHPISQHYELIFVNDGSRDHTMDVLKRLASLDPRIRFISFSRNFGHQIAVSAGLDFCSGKAVVVIDDDLQDPPELIPALYEQYLAGYKVVYARRKKRIGESWFKVITARLFYRLLSQLTNIDIPLDTGDFRLMDKQVVDYLRQMPEKSKFIRGQVAWIGFPQIAVDYDRESRKAGKSGYSIKKLLRLAIDGISSFSDIPLRLATWAGFIVSGVAFTIILYALFSYFFLDRSVTGWASLIISMMFVGGVQLLTIGIIGEYISRIVADVRDRPLYIIGETNISRTTQD